MLILNIDGEMIEMSYTIKKLSSNGFLLSDLGWKSVDTFKILKSKTFPFKFEDLKIGDKLDSLKFNNEGYVIDFIVLKHEDKEVEVKSSLNSVKQSSFSSSSPPSSIRGCNILERGNALNPLGQKDLFNSSSVQENIRYGQCVNIAFQSNKNDLTFQNGRFIKEAFDLADEIYKEFNLRCSR